MSVETPPVSIERFAPKPATITGGEALERLARGNARFAAGTPAPLIGAQLLERRAELSQNQEPFAVVVSCSDSRVAPEIIFDQTLGDIFVVRTAGEVLDSAVLASIEYAVQHFPVSLIVVLGHERCGAVSAAVTGATEPGHIPDLLKAIRPAADRGKARPGDAVENAVHLQAVEVARQLQASTPVISSHVQAGRLTVLGAYYNLDTGKAEFFKP